MLAELQLPAQRVTTSEARLTRRMQPKPVSAIKRDELSDMMSMPPGLLK